MFATTIQSSENFLVFLKCAKVCPDQLSYCFVSFEMHFVRDIFDRDRVYSEAKTF